ncbi:hypothetical protein [Hymenobacter latericus]|uniref:hypothetical protein n=1 Tax=Hymenobacter sp. YIM 151858-1 TaxID=2987688 RepID=UPI002225EE81|nr:hypothetical protein [Hymenobacter sp. YIM 151858-1]UYZ60150.1 hypothetical protein OIS50_04945 [Hymenobacter sp. YIM 151858-1]
MHEPHHYAAEAVRQFAQREADGTDFALSRDEHVHCVAKLAVELYAQDAEKYRTNLALAIIRSQPTVCPDFTGAAV